MPCGWGEDDKLSLDKIQSRTAHSSPTSANHNRSDLGACVTVHVCSTAVKGDREAMIDECCRPKVCRPGDWLPAASTEADICDMKAAPTAPLP